MDIDKRRRTISTGVWIILGTSAAAFFLAGLLSSGQDLAGAGMVQAFSILGAAIVVVPTGVVVVWAAWRPWKQLSSWYKVWVISVWLLVLLPVAAILVSAAFTFLIPTQPTYPYL